jgi:hypothetical protein
MCVVAHWNKASTLRLGGWKEIVMQNDDHEQKIRERAYQIWIDEGQPHGRDQEHWSKAEAEIEHQPSPPLQPDQSVKQQLDKSNPKSVTPVAGGTNPDDVTR